MFSEQLKNVTLNPVWKGCVPSTVSKHTDDDKNPTVGGPKQLLYLHSERLLYSPRRALHTATREAFASMVGAV